MRSFLLYDIRPFTGGFKGGIPRGGSYPLVHIWPYKLPTGGKMSRVKTEQLVVLILYRCVGLRKDLSFNITVRDIQEKLLSDFGREITTAHIRRIIHSLEHKGFIEKESHYLNGGRYGHNSQANRYKVKDVLRLFNVCPSDRDLKNLQRKAVKERAVKQGMPLTCFKPGYIPSLAYIENYSPYYRAATQANLGPKFARGDPRNMERQRRVNSIMSELKRERRYGREGL